jgi:hypothetical protein
MRLFFFFFFLLCLCTLVYTTSSTTIQFHNCSRPISSREARVITPFNHPDTSVKWSSIANKVNTSLLYYKICATPGDIILKDLIRISLTWQPNNHFANITYDHFICHDYQAKFICDFQLRQNGCIDGESQINVEYPSHLQLDILRSGLFQNTPIISLYSLPSFRYDTQQPPSLMRLADGCYKSISN